MEIKWDETEIIYVCYVQVENTRSRVEIAFKGGKFKHVNYPFAGKYTRDMWRALALIEQTIAEIEENIKLSPDTDAIEAHSTYMRKLLTCVAVSEVVLNGTKQPYLVVNINRDLWQQIRQFVGEGK